MKQIVLIISIFISSLSFGQVLKGVYPNHIIPEDSNTILFEFSGSHFTRYQSPYLLIKNGFAEAKIINDSTLSFSIAPFISAPEESAYDIQISCSDASWNPIVLSYPQLLIRKNRDDAFLMIDSSYQFQTIPAFIDFKIRGKNSHFTSGVNHIQIKPLNAEAYAYSLNTIRVINDSLMYARLNSNNLIELGNYQFKVSNRTDGTLYTKQNIPIGRNPFSIQIIKNFIAQKGDSIAVKLMYTDLKGNTPLKFAYNNELSLYNDGSSQQVLKTTVSTYLKDSNQNGITHQYLFRFVLPLKMKTGLLDIHFTNDSVGTFLFKNAFSVFHDKPYVPSGLKSMAGRNFQFYLSFLDTKNLPDSFGFKFLKYGNLSNEVVVDSFINMGSGFWQIHGHSTMNAKGQYHFQTQTKEDIYTYMDFISISEYYPFAFKLNPSHFYKDEDSVSVLAQSEYYTLFDFVNNLSDYGFEKNGQLIQGMYLQVNTADPTHNFKIKMPKGLGKGWYDLRYFNKMKQTWEIQKNACFVYGDVKGYEINKNKIASNGTGPIRIQMKFNGTHFTQSGLSLMNNNSHVKIINDSLVEFPFSAPENSLPGFMGFTSYNDIDGYIPCFPVIEVFTYPKIVALNPSSGKAGDTIDVWVYADMSTFTQFPDDLSLSFRKSDQIQSKMNILEKEVINDSLLKIKLSIESEMPAGKLSFGIYQNQRFAYYQLQNAFEVINSQTSLKETESNLYSAKVYPNPSKGIVYIDNKESKHTDFRIYDLKGSLIYKNKLDNNINEINLQEILPKNQLYIFELVGEKNIYKRILIE